MTRSSRSPLCFFPAFAAAAPPAVTAVAYQPGRQARRVRLDGQVRLFDAERRRACAERSGRRGPRHRARVRPAREVARGRGGEPGKSGEVRCSASSRAARDIGAISTQASRHTRTRSTRWRSRRTASHSPPPGYDRAHSPLGCLRSTASSSSEVSAADAQGSQRRGLRPGVPPGRHAARVRRRRSRGEGVGRRDRQAALHARRSDRLGLLRRVEPRQEASRGRRSGQERPRLGRRPATAGSSSTPCSRTRNRSGGSRYADGRRRRSLPPARTGHQVVGTRRMSEKKVYRCSSPTACSISQLRPDGKQLAVARFDGVALVLDVRDRQVDQRSCSRRKPVAAEGREAHPAWRSRARPPRIIA